MPGGIKITHSLSSLVKNWKGKSFLQQGMGPVVMQIPVLVTPDLTRKGAINGIQLAGTQLIVSETFVENSLSNAENYLVHIANA